MNSESDWPFNVSLIDSDTAYVAMHESRGEITLEEVKKLTKVLGELSGGKKLNVIIEILSFNTITKDARKYSASEESQIYTKANAIIVKSLAMRIGANFFINMSRPVRPTKVFNQKVDALNWFKSM